MSKQQHGAGETSVQRRARLLNLQAQRSTPPGRQSEASGTQTSQSRQTFMNPHFDPPRERLVQRQRELLSTYPNLIPVLSEDLMSSYMEVDDDEQDWSEAMDFDAAEFDQQPTAISESMPEVINPSSQAMPKKARTARSIIPTQRSIRLYGQWLAMLPQLVEERLFFERRAANGEWDDEDPAAYRCPTHPGTRETLCIQFLRYDVVHVATCDCLPAAKRLVRSGYFPSTVSEPSIAFSFDLLDFFKRLYEEASDATAAMAGALVNFLGDKGFTFVNSQGLPIDEPIRRSLGSAVQWYDLLSIRVDSEIERAIEEGRIEAEKILKERQGREDVAGATKCSTLLRDRCPACFGGDVFGSSLTDGGDFQVAVDANFAHRHQRASGESPQFYVPTIFISKEEVDEIGEHILAARKQPTKTWEDTKVPDHAVDACERSFTAADESAAKTKGERFDDTGISALVCRHDIPLFMCNIDTPGEQQKYAVALVTRFFENISKTATVTVLYDIGCVLHRSVKRYGLFEESIIERLQWATSAMHAYGHEWVCQLSNNPRLMDGQGLTDGEGTERLWSRLVPLIGITRSSGRRRRIYLLDRRALRISHMKVDDLGRWLRSREKRVIRYRQELQEPVVSSGLTIGELRDQWIAQRTSQQSVRSHAPARLKKQMESVLMLQDTIEQLEQHIRAARKVIATGDAPPAANVLLGVLDERQTGLVHSAEELYSALNIHETFPALAGASFGFVHTLLMARDLKILLRQRIVGRFFEMTRIDQSAGGTDATLGTKLHQQSRQNLAKRSATITTSLKKFNSYCAKLATLARPEWAIPLPQALPTSLDGLKDNPYLYEDVWVEPTPDGPPKWLTDTDVRKAIKAMLKLDRCQEERVRLYREGENMRKWYRDKLVSVALAVAIETKGEGKLLPRLVLHQNKLLHLRFRWSNPFVTATQWEHCVSDAVATLLRFVEGRQWELPASFVSTLTPADYGEASGTTGRSSPSKLAEMLFETDEGVDTEDDTRIYAQEAVDEETWALQDMAPPYETGEYAMSDSTEDISRPNSEDGDTPEVVDPTSDALEQSGGFDDVLVETKPPFRYSASVDNLDDMNWRTLTNPPRVAQCFCPAPAGFLFVDIDSQSYQRLTHSKGRLDDLVINGVFALFAAMYPRDDLLVFTTYQLRSVQDGANDAVLRRRFSPTLAQIGGVEAFTVRGQWIVPIHRQQQQHWTMAVVDFCRREIALFDSFADPGTLAMDLRDIIELVEAVLRVCRPQSGYQMNWQGWHSYSPLRGPVQTNGYDCGLWIIAQYLATRRGYARTGLCEDDMPTLRTYIATFVVNASTK